MLKALIAPYLVLGLALLVCAPPDASPGHSEVVKYQEARRLMWTTFEIIAYGRERPRLVAAANAAFEEIDRLDRQLSNYSETSELTYINRNAAKGEVVVEKELFELLKLALDYSRTTDGTFDITVGPLMKAWGFFKGQGRFPEPNELKTVLAKTGSAHVMLNSQSRTVRFDREGVELDLGGIAKGYAVDKAAEILRESGVTSALITCGSSIYAIGAPPDQGFWQVDVRNPLDPSNRVTSVELKDNSLSTSGCYEKIFTLGGKTYCHIMNPRTGYPIGDMLSATVLTPRGVDAEVFSKALMVLGVLKAKDFVKQRKDIRALLCYRKADGTVESTRLNF
jgi:thiamine biosynthesis lipoprotein